MSKSLAGSYGPNLPSEPFFVKYIIPLEGEGGVGGKDVTALPGDVINPARAANSSSMTASRAEEARRVAK